MIFNRVRWRLMALNAVVMAGVVAALGAAIVLLLNHLLMAQTTSELRREVDRVRMEASERDTRDLRMHHDAVASGTFYVLWDAHGRVVLDPSEVTTAPLRPSALRALHGSATTSTIELRDDHYALVISEPLPNGRGALQVGRNLDLVRTVETQALAVVSIAGACTLLLVVAASWFLAERALVPIRQAFERQRQFTADASHELRTPLSVLDAGLQVLRRHPDQTIEQNEDVLRSLEGETRRMGRLVAGLLTLARADAGEGEIHPLAFDVDAMIQETVRALEPVAKARGVRLELVECRGGQVTADPDRLKQVLLILLDNALRFSPRGEAVQVRCLRAGREVELQVTDRGPGIPAQERARVFERFYQLDANRDGTSGGLGLAIARWIVRAHGGTIQLHDHAPGLMARARIPLSPPATRGRRGRALTWFPRRPQETTRRERRDQS
jgi:two-component system sensor histidine kinase CiaH